MEREIFQRVQLGMALTTAEKLAAVDSPWAESVRLLSSLCELTQMFVDGSLTLKAATSVSPFPFNLHEYT
jgi:hypothetical protein